MGSLVVITGASSGLGLALAQTAPFSARIVDISRSGPPVGSDIEHLEADLADPVQLEKVSAWLLERVEAERPTRAVFIHAAGTISPIGFAGEVEYTAYANNVLLNSAAGQILGHAFLEAVKEYKGQFDLVMISSGAASKTYPGWSAYSAGKAALDHWVRTVGVEQQSRGGVRVLAIAPGVLDTAMQEQIRATDQNDFPDVDRFRQLDQDDELIAPDDAARKLWDLLEDAQLETGSVVDLRDYR